MKRFYFISYASVTLEVDQMVLEPVAREVRLDVDPETSLGPQPALLELDYSSALPICRRRVASRR